MPNELNDSFESLDVSPEEKEQARTLEIQQMSGRYSSSVMSRILESSYAKVPGLTHDIFFTRNAFIFSPSTDKADCVLPLVEELIRAIEGQDISSEILLFPIAEQQPFIKIPFFSHLVPPRNHWVTLHYSTKTEIATVIDSRPLLNSFMYSYEGLKNTLSKGLESLQLSIKEFNVIQQGLQFDDIYCGSWTAINIESLAYGATIPSLTSTFTSESIQSIVQHHIDKVFYDKKGCLRKDLINFDIINEYKITPPNIEPIIKKLLSHTDAALLVELINHRENIVFNGKPLSLSNPLLPSKLKHVLQELRRKYHGILATEIASHAVSTQGYSIKDPGRLLNNLHNIGLNEKEINAFSLIEILFYDAVVFYATSEIEMQIQMQILEILSKLGEVNESTMMEGGLYFNQKNLDVRKQALFILKEKILEHYRHEVNARKMQRLPIKSLNLAKKPLINRQDTDSMQKPIKIKHLVVVNRKTSSILGNLRLIQGKFTDIIFTNHVNGYSQLIRVNYQDVLRDPICIAQCLLDTMKEYGWDLSTTRMTTYVENKDKCVADEKSFLLTDVSVKSGIEVPSNLALAVSEERVSEVFEERVSEVSEERVSEVSEERVSEVSEERVSDKNELESSNGSLSCSDCLWAMMVWLYQFLIQILEMISQSMVYKENSSPRPF